LSQIWLQRRYENKWSEVSLLLLLLANVLEPNLDIWQLRTGDFFQFGEVHKLAIIFHKKKRENLFEITLEIRFVPFFYFPKKIHRMLLFWAFSIVNLPKIKHWDRSTTCYEYLQLLKKFWPAWQQRPPFLARNIITSIGWQLLLNFLVPGGGQESSLGDSGLQ
jgi:hypothetical protein